MVQANELISLILGVVGATMVLLVFRPSRGTELMPFWFGFFAMVTASIATVAEGFVLPEVLNCVEHFSLAASGVAFAIGTVRLARTAGAVSER